MAIARLAGLLFAATVFGQAAVPAAAQDYPTRQITIVVPFVPGGSVDFIGRIVGQKLSDRLGRPVKIVREAGLAGSL